MTGFHFTCESVAEVFRNDPFGFGNEVLYALCRDEPGHAETEVIVAKTWLIGRSYGVALERFKVAGKPESEAFYTECVAPAMRNSGLDRRLSDLAGAEFGTESLPQLLEVHWSVVDSLRGEVTRVLVRSFASKYLHFHLPGLFPIYDSRALKALGGEPKVAVDLSTAANDAEYAGFCRRLLSFRARIQERCGHRLNLRQLDRLLLDY